MFKLNGKDKHFTHEQATSSSKLIMFMNPDFLYQLRRIKYYTPWTILWTMLFMHDKRFFKHSLADNSIRSCQQLSATFQGAFMKEKLKPVFHKIRKIR